MQSFIGCKLYVLETLRTFIGILFTVLHHPHTRRNANVIITAKRRHDVIIVLSLRHILAGMCQQIGPSKPPSEFMSMPLQWRHNYRDGVSNHQPHDCLLNRLFRRRSKKTSKLRVNGRWTVNSPHKVPVTRKMFPFGDVIMAGKSLNSKYKSYFIHEYSVIKGSMPWWLKYIDYNLIGLPFYDILPMAV